MNLNDHPDAPFVRYKSRHVVSWTLVNFTRQLFLWGEQVFPVAVRQSDGAVRLGYIDPADIEMVVSHPANPMERWAVVTRPQQQSAAQPWRPSDRRT